MITVLYHSDNDGFGAAYAAWSLLGSNANFIPVQYGQPVPELPEGTTEIHILDFSYDRATCDALAQKYKLLVIDHHKTAKAVLHDAPYAKFNMEKSGAVLAWEHYRPGLGAPALLRYVQDYDMWKFELRDSKEINLFISTLEWDFPVWSKWAQKNETDFILAAATLGAAVRNFRDKQVDHVVKQARMMTLTVDGHVYVVPVVNADHLIRDEVGHELCAAYPSSKFSASYRDRSDIRCWSLRSVGDFDVSVLAKLMGGGGHKNAAGFETPLGWPERVAPEQELAFMEAAAAAEKVCELCAGTGRVNTENSTGGTLVFEDCPACTAKEES